MIPIVNASSTLLPLYQHFIEELIAGEFTGEVCTDYATRLSVATDNSVYQVIPQAVVFPKKAHDVAILFEIAKCERFRKITFAPRGGGVATNGQSLSPGIIIDCSKYLRQILEVNLQEKWVRVQPGVIQDQLNAFLKPLGFYFPPEISPSNRATLGGMINTDACGNGSKILGRTSDYVKDLQCVLVNGHMFHTQKPNLKLTKTITDLIQKHEPLILQIFADTPRTLAGYNLKNVVLHPGNLNYLIGGSEGTLAVVTECTLRIEPIPKFKKLVVLKYKNFEDALNSKIYSKTVQPLVIETIDERLIELARNDSLFFTIKDFIDSPNRTTGAVNLVEFVGDNLEQIDESILSLCSNLDENVLGYYISQNNEEIKRLWDLRKKAVGLISKKLVGTRRPIPFIEDTAVPPEKLGAYIAEFKELLDSHQLTYGMYGHIDAGCVHVRPALDMRVPSDEILMQELSKKVVALVKKFGGVLWGEHGQGFRSEYGREFFGETLYAVVTHIKTLFDPYNQLNPGKIAVSPHTEEKLVAIDKPLRGHFDKQILTDLENNFPQAIACNGNGACFNYATQDIMCPSYKVTRNRVHSPKGRSALIREWLRILSVKTKPQPMQDFSHEVYAAMNGCLGCKACTSQCPISVDVPDLKVKFLEMYHTRYRRPLRDFFVSRLEYIVTLQAKFAAVNNLFNNMPAIRFLVKRFLKLVDLPNIASHHKFSSAPLTKAHIILLQDAFTTFYQPEIFSATIQLLTRLGYAVHVPNFFPNGKPLHAKGYLKKFHELVLKNSRYLETLNLPIIGLEPSITLTYRDEYKKVNPTFQTKVMLLQEWLKTVSFPKLFAVKQEYFLLIHCTEKSAVPESEKFWQEIFANFGLALTPLTAGCCGMAGSYGHEIEHIENSKKLFAMDWLAHVKNNPDTVLATGYSCRTQAKRLIDIRLKHPVEILAECLT